MSDVRVCIPVKPEVYKFLKTQFGEEYRVDMRNMLGIVLFHIFKKQVNSRKNELYSIQKNYTCKYVVIFSNFHFFNLAPKEISPFSVTQFNLFIENLIDFVFIQNTTSLLIEKPKNIKTAIETFIDSNDLGEEDLTYDAFKKQYYRFKKKKKPLKLSSFK